MNRSKYIVLSLERSPSPLVSTFFAVWDGSEFSRFTLIAQTQSEWSGWNATKPVISTFRRQGYSPSEKTDYHPMALNIESVVGEKAPFLTKEETSVLNDMSAIVLIDGIAVVDEEKAKKLKLFLLKRILPFGSVVHNDVFIPMNPETKMSLG
jgi:singapore isolate B (sub-type 7) whole genome shotgun sequence assembly, scaffold_10